MISRLTPSKTGLLALAALAITAFGAAAPADAKPFKNSGLTIVIGDSGHGFHDGYGECRWLKRKAMKTGSPYWWRRYQECRYWH